jgi:hypothetical protein
MKKSTYALTLALLVFVAPIGLFAHTVGIETDKANGPLKPGEYFWKPELSPRGPVVLVVSLPQQVMVVYRNGIQIARSTVSTGAGKKATPTGVFEILQKKQEHYSNIYNNAPMPYMQRLTWTGIALHAGKLPGYPASKGCIRLPYDFSQRLYSVTKMGGIVVIANDKSPNAALAASPGLALTAHNQSANMLQRLTNLDYRWTPEKSPTGPVTILISGADSQLYVYRSGILIGRGSFLFRSSRSRSLGEHVFTLLEGTTSDANPWLPGSKARPWAEVDPDSHDLGMTAQDIASELRIAPDFANKLYDLATPGTTVVVTDEPALRDSDRSIVSTD